ncbi:hypothetical protein SALBM311S_02422 [Streptomyces alboniger]
MSASWCYQRRPPPGRSRLLRPQAGGVPRPSPERTEAPVDEAPGELHGAPVRSAVASTGYRFVSITARAISAGYPPVTMSAAPAIGDREVPLPGGQAAGRRCSQVPRMLSPSSSTSPVNRCRKSRGEKSGFFPQQPPYPVGEGHRVQPRDAPRVEVVLGVRACLGVDRDDRCAVRCLGHGDLGVLDQEPSVQGPLENAACGGRRQAGRSASITHAPTRTSNLRRASCRADSSVAPIAHASSQSSGSPRRGDLGGGRNSSVVLRSLLFLLVPLHLPSCCSSCCSSWRGRSARGVMDGAARSVVASGSIKESP